MEYQKIINLLDNTPNQPTDFRTTNWVETNDGGPGIYDTDSKINFKTSMVKSSLCDYSDVYILVCFFVFLFFLFLYKLYHTP